MLFLQGRSVIDFSDLFSSLNSEYYWIVEKNNRKAILANFFPVHSLLCRSQEDCGRLRYFGCLLTFAP
jgi:hypothetical protein